MNEEKPKNTFVEKVKGLIVGEFEPNSRIEKQIVLAYEMYRRFNPQENINLEDQKDRDKFMLFWSPLERKEDCFSVIFSRIENDPGFANHERLQGDINKITIDDVLYYKENNKLPEDSEEEREAAE